MLQHPNIDPVAVSIGPVALHWYGIMYLLGFAMAWWLAARRAASGRYPLQREQVADLIFYGALGVLIGGRLGYALFYAMPQMIADPLWLLQIWRGGMSFHGGLVGVIVALWLYARHLHIPTGALLDFVAPLVPIGLGLGRLGNFIGQELWGRSTDVAWGMVFPADPSQLVRHPSQLYQALLEGVVLFVIVFWFSAKPRPRWSVSGLFLLCYGLFRFIVEYFRQPDAHIGFDALGWLTRGQLLSLPMIIIGLVLLFVAYQKPLIDGNVACNKRKPR